MELDNIFNSFSQNKIFEDKSVLQNNYLPDVIPHRDKQIEQIASILAPALRGEKTSNLFVYGQTGCISGESLVYTEQGYIPIREMEEKSCKILSFNISEKAYEWETPLFLKYENKDKLLKIILDNGNELVVTKDHPLLDSSFGWKKADEFKINDELIFSSNIPNLNSFGSVILARVLGFILADGSMNKQLKRTKDGRGEWYNANRQRLRYFTDDLRLLNFVKRDLESIYPHKASILFPKDRVSHLNMISQIACGNLNDLGVPFGEKSGVIEVPRFIFNSNSTCQSEFVKAVFTSDGYVSQNTYMIELFSKSKKFLQGVSLLLHGFGIRCKIRYKKTRLHGNYFDMYRLYVMGQENLIRFYHRIGLFSEKQKKLRKLLSSYQKNMPPYDKNYVPYRISAIEEVFEPFVYDLTVPKNHNFIANGIISHNTGKTLSVQFVKDELLRRFKNTENGKKLRIEYLNCKLKKVADTEYRILAELIKKLGGEVPATGLPTDQVYNRFIELVEKEDQLIILIMDEIDQAVKKMSDNFLYNLTRLNSELAKTQIGIVGISNDLNFLDSLDPRVRSSLSEEELIFPPYNALQLQEILGKRAEKAFKKNTLQDGVLSKCAAYAAREHGDARRALDLLRVAGELAERDGKSNVGLEHVDLANEKMDRDKVLDIVQSAPKQFQLVLWAIINLSEKKKGNLFPDTKAPIFTGDIFNVYQQLCGKTKTEILTQRRVGDLIAEADMMGLINAQVISKGRHGRTREIKLSVPTAILPKTKAILQEALGF